MERATGLSGAVERTASMLGVGLAGVLVATVGAANALLVDAVSFGVSAAGARVGDRRGCRGWRRRQSDRRPGRLPTQLREGWDFLRGDRLLLGIARDGRADQPARHGLVCGADAGVVARARPRAAATRAAASPCAAPPRPSARCAPPLGRTTPALHRLPGRVPDRRAPALRGPGVRHPAGGGAGGLRGRRLRVRLPQPGAGRGDLRADPAAPGGPRQLAEQRDVLGPDAAGRSARRHAGRRRAAWPSRCWPPASPTSWSRCCPARRPALARDGPASERPSARGELARPRRPRRSRSGRAHRRRRSRGRVTDPGTPSSRGRSPPRPEQPVVGLGLADRDPARPRRRTVAPRCRPRRRPPRTRRCASPSANQTKLPCGSGPSQPALAQRRRRPGRARRPARRPARAAPPRRPATRSPPPGRRPRRRTAATPRAGRAAIGSCATAYPTRKPASP